MRTILIQPTLDAWREAARDLLTRQVPPQEILWSDDPGETSLFSAESATTAATGTGFRVPASFPGLARSVAAHSDPRRWALLYRILWRVACGGESRLLQIPTDPDVRLASQWAKAVGRDIHKMHAFVRFRLVATDEATGRERFVAWFEPEHRIVRLAAPFFQKRFTNMDWSILTPNECVHWDGKSMEFTPGVSQREAPDDDAHDDLWRTYYRSIFNPARLKVNAMMSEMPKKYWKNLPEARLIAGLIADSRSRVQTMLDAELRPVKPAPANPYLESLKKLNQPSDEQ